MAYACSHIRFTNLCDGPAEGISAPGNAALRDENRNKVFAVKARRLLCREMGRDDMLDVFCGIGLSLGFADGIPG